MNQPKRNKYSAIVIASYVCVTCSPQHSANMFLLEHHDPHSGNPHLRPNLVVIPPPISPHYHLQDETVKFLQQLYDELMGAGGHTKFSLPR